MNKHQSIRKSVIYIGDTKPQRNPKLNHYENDSDVKSLVCTRYILTCYSFLHFYFQVSFTNQDNCAYNQLFGFGCF